MPQNSSPSLAFSLYDIDGLTLHVGEAGPKDGPAVILLHGFPEFWWGWRHQIASLAEAGFRVIVPDQRGYNLSGKPQGRRSYDLDLLAGDILGLADKLGLESFNLAGHDWGGIVAWWIATTHPERVRRLVAVNAPHPSVLGSYMRAHPGQLLRSSYVLFHQIPHVPEMLMRAGGYRLLKDALAKSARPGTFTEADFAVYQEAWDRPGALTAMVNWYRAIPLTSGKPFRGRLSMPVLVIWGRQDSFMESGIAEESLKLCDRGNLHWFEDATHWVHLEEPQAVSAALKAFWAD